MSFVSLEPNAKVPKVAGERPRKYRGAPTWPEVFFVARQCRFFTVRRANRGREEMQPLLTHSRCEACICASDRTASWAHKVVHTEMSLCGRTRIMSPGLHPTSAMPSLKISTPAGTADKRKSHLAKAGYSARQSPATPPDTDANVGCLGFIPAPTQAVCATGDVPGASPRVECTGPLGR